MRVTVIWWIAGIIAAGCVWGIIVLVKVSLTDGLLWYARLGAEQKLVKVPCVNCGGYGIQYLAKGKINNLTPATRDRKKGVWAWGAPLGNKHSCIRCKGHGFNWAPATKENTHSYQR